MAGEEERQLEWIQAGVRRLEERLVRDFVEKNQENEMQIILDRRTRLKELLKSEAEHHEKELLEKVCNEQEEQIRKRKSEMEEEIRSKEEAKNFHAMNARRIQERENCPYYRESFSREISLAINASRQNEIELKKLLKRHVN